VPDAVRSLSERLEGTHRIFKRQRLAFATFAALALAVAMQGFLRGA